MKDLKVLTKLHSKVRCRTVFLSEQVLNNTFLFCKQIPFDCFFSLKKKVSANKFSLHLLNVYGTKARIKTIIEWTRQDCFVKNKGLFTVRSPQKLVVSTGSYNKEQAIPLFKFLNTLSPTPTFLCNLQKLTQEKEVEVCGIKKISLLTSTRNLVGLDGISISLICSESYLGKCTLKSNPLLNDRVLTLRSSNTFFKKREKHKMIRPLLEFKRENITMICKDFQMPVYPDQSNRSVQYSRNRIRKQLIPSIKYFINPQIESSLFKLAELLNKEQFFLYSVLRNTSNKAVTKV